METQKKGEQERQGGKRTVEPDPRHKQDQDPNRPGRDPQRDRDDDAREGDRS